MTFIWTEESAAFKSNHMFINWCQYYIYMYCLFQCQPLSESTQFIYSCQVVGQNSHLVFQGHTSKKTQSLCEIRFIWDYERLTSHSQDTIAFVIQVTCLDHHKDNNVTGGGTWGK